MMNVGALLLQAALHPTVQWASEDTNKELELAHG